MPSTIVTVRRTSAMMPLARVAYQNAVEFTASPLLGFLRASR